MNDRIIRAMLADMTPEPTFDLDADGKKIRRKAFDLDTIPTRRKPQPSLSTVTLSRTRPKSRDPVLQQVRQQQRHIWEAKFKNGEQSDVSKSYSFYSQTGIVEPYVPSSLLGSDAVTRKERLSVKKEFTFTGYDIMSDASASPPKPKEGIDILTQKKNVDTYREACNRLGVAPVQALEQSINSDSIQLGRYGLGPTGTKALAVALVNNDMVRSISLVDNWMETEGACAIGEMLYANHRLTELDIAENVIGQEGLTRIIEAVSEHRKIKKLNMSGTGIHDRDANLIKTVLQKNIYLCELYLARNKLAEDGGVALAQGLAGNETLELLDVSWNHLRRQGAVCIAAALKKNQSLVTLDISWNGFALSGCKELGKALAVNTTLTDLNLSANRVTSDALSSFLDGLQHNEGLIKLTLNYNPISPKIATTILKTISKSEKCTLEVLDMEDIVVEKEFVNTLKRINETRPIIINHGHVIEKSTVIGGQTSSFAYLDPRILLFYLMEKEGMRVIDLFHKLDTDGSQSLSRHEFKKGLVAAGLPFTEDQLDQLVNKLDEDGDGEVSLEELLHGERLFKRQRLANKGKFKIPKDILEHVRKTERKKEGSTTPEKREQSIEEILFPT